MPFPEVTCICDLSCPSPTIWRAMGFFFCSGNELTACPGPFQISSSAQWTTLVFLLSSHNTLLGPFICTLSAFVEIWCLFTTFPFRSYSHRLACLQEVVFCTWVEQSVHVMVQGESSRKLGGEQSQSLHTCCASRSGGVGCSYRIPTQKWWEILRLEESPSTLL